MKFVSNEPEEIEIEREGNIQAEDWASKSLAEFVTRVLITEWLVTGAHWQQYPELAAIP